MNLRESMQWRYATKRMNGQIVPEQKLNNILEAIRLTPTSMGLQPFRVFVISSQAMKDKISESACKQPQIKACSHLLVFASFKNITIDIIDEYIMRVSSERGVLPESMADYTKMIKGFVSSRSDEQNAEWASKQAYIALGSALIAAAAEQVDSTPMEGFNPDLMDEILDLKETNLKTTLLMPLGYRDEKNDYLVNAKKVRLQHKDFFIFK